MSWFVLHNISSDSYQLQLKSLICHTDTRKASLTNTGHILTYSIY